MKIKALCEDCGKEFWVEIGRNFIMEHVHKELEKDVCK
jgi:hypothetical protein